MLTGCAFSGGGQRESFETSEDYAEMQEKMLGYLNETYPDREWETYEGETALHRTYSGTYTTTLKSVYGYFSGTGLDSPVMLEYSVQNKSFSDNYWDCVYYGQLLDYCAEKVEEAFPGCSYCLRADRHSPETTAGLSGGKDVTFETYRKMNFQSVPYLIELKSFDGFNEGLKKLIDGFDYMWGSYFEFAVPPQYSISDMRITAVPVKMFTDYTTFGYGEGTVTEGFDWERYDAEGWGKIRADGIYRTYDDKDLLTEPECHYASRTAGTSVGKWSSYDGDKSLYGASEGFVTGMTYEEALTAGGAGAGNDDDDKPGGITPVTMPDIDPDEIWRGD